MITIQFNKSSGFYHGSFTYFEFACINESIMRKDDENILQKLLKFYTTNFIKLRFVI